MACTETTSLRRLARRLWRREDGATAIEYALIAGGLSIVIAATVFGVGETLRKEKFEKVLDAFVASTSSE
jgi:pilus assembly protein Flp/PilA